MRNRNLYLSFLVSEHIHLYLWRASAVVSPDRSSDWVHHGLEIKRVRGHE